MLAVVTGAGIRLGRAISLALGRAGYDLVLHANRSRDAADAVAAELVAMGRRASVETADLSVAREVDALGAKLVKAHGSIDVLVNNAGLYDETPFAHVSRAAYARLHAVNFEAPLFLTQALLPALGGGAVINITDVLAERPLPGIAHYAPTKAALIALTKALAVELAPGIRVNAVSPGAAQIPDGFSEAERQAVLSRVPLGREGRAEDVAGAVLYLATAPYVTGAVLNVDGGFFAGAC